MVLPASLIISHPDLTPSTTPSPTSFLPFVKFQNRTTLQFTTSVPTPEQTQRLRCVPTHCCTPQSLTVHLLVDRPAPNYDRSLPGPNALVQRIPSFARLPQRSFPETAADAPSHRSVFLREREAFPTPRNTAGVLRTWALRTRIPSARHKRGLSPTCPTEGSLLIPLPSRIALSLQAEEQHIMGLAGKMKRKFSLSTLQSVSCAKFDDP